MKTRKSMTPTAIALGLLVTASLTQAQIYDEEFDGTGNGYNPDSTTALVGDDDWVDFRSPTDTSSRITTDFSGNEGYFTAVGGSESVLTGRSDHNDIQIRTDFSPGIAKGDVGRIEIRARIDADQNNIYDDALVAANLSLFWGTGSYVNPGAANGNPGVSFNSIATATEVIAESDGWHLFVWKDAGGLVGGTGSTVGSFRLDPVNNNIGASFEVDYFKIEQSTFIQIDPATAVPTGPGEFTLKEEWTFDSDAEGWTVGANGHFTLGAFAGGLLTGISDNGGDSMLNSPDFEVLDVESGQFIVELGLVVDEDDDTEKLLFWKLDGGGADPNKKVTISGVPSDGGLHVVRINFDDVINDRITGLRYDPSNAMNITSSLDYVRIYSKGAEIPYFPPPVAELDPAPLGAGFLLQQEWDWNDADDLDGWVTSDMVFMNPNNSDTGVFNSAMFGEAIGIDPKFISPAFMVNPPASQQLVVEIDFDALGAPGTGGQLFWIDDTPGFAGSRSVVTPVVTFDESPHTVRITFTNNLEGALRQLRFDPTNVDMTYFGIDAIRIYTNGPPVSAEAPRITSFSYDSTTGISEAVLLGNPATVYTFASAADLDFTASTPITLTGVTVGTLSGGGVETDGSGNATVQFNIGAGSANFVRAEN